MDGLSTIAGDFVGGRLPRILLLSSDVSLAGVRRMERSGYIYPNHDWISDSWQSRVGLRLPDGTPVNGGCGIMQSGIRAVRAHHRFSWR